MPAPHSQTPAGQGSRRHGRHNPVLGITAQAGQVRTSFKDQVHGVLAKLGIPVTCSDIFGVRGTRWLDGLRLPQPYCWKVASLRQLAG